MCEVAAEPEDKLVLAACCGQTAAVGIFLFITALGLAVSRLLAPISSKKVDELLTETKPGLVRKRREWTIFLLPTVLFPSPACRRPKVSQLVRQTVIRPDLMPR